MTTYLVREAVWHPCGPTLDEHEASLPVMTRYRLPCGCTEHCFKTCDGADYWNVPRRFRCGRHGGAQ